MELILILTKIVQWLVVDPIWWFSGWVAGLFFPEYSHEHLGIAWIVALLIGFGAVAALMLLLTHG